MTARRAVFAAFTIGTLSIGHFPSYGEVEGGGWSGGRGELLESVFKDLCDTQDRNLGQDNRKKRRGDPSAVLFCFFIQGAKLAQVQVLGSRIGGLGCCQCFEDEKKQKVDYAQLEYSSVPSCKQASVRGFVKAHVLSEKDKPDDDVSASDLCLCFHPPEH